jgi:hypothetical protein
MRLLFYNGEHPPELVNDRSRARIGRLVVLRDALPRGSFLILSHATMDGYPAAADDENRAGRVYDGQPPRW